MSLSSAKGRLMRESNMPERVHCGRAMAVCAFVLLACADGYAQTTTAERPNGSRSVGALTDVQGFGKSDDLSESARVSVTLRAWQWRPVEASSERRVIVGSDHAKGSPGRSRRKAVLIGAAIGGGVGAGGGAYALYANRSDGGEPWLVPGFAGIGAAVGAACGFLFSLF